jgi:hypothetical protein
MTEKQILLIVVKMEIVFGDFVNVNQTKHYVEGSWVPTMNRQLLRRSSETIPKVFRKMVNIPIQQGY